MINLVSTKAYELLQNKSYKTLIIDVREKHECQKYGLPNIKNLLHLPMSIGIEKIINLLLDTPYLASDINHLNHILFLP